MDGNETELLRRNLFGGASDRVVALFAAASIRQTLAPGEALFEQGDAGDTLFIVERGLIEISVTSSEGRKISLDVMGPGDFIGEIAFFDPGPRTASAIARELSQVISYDRKRVLSAASTDASLGLELVEMVAKRLRWVSQQLHEQVFLPLPERLARKLLYLTSGDSESPSQVLRMSQNDLADFVGASREAVSKTLTLWRQDEVIDLGRQKVIVLDRSALKALAGFDLL